MISFNSPSISQKSNKGVFINHHITVQAAAEATGYNIQYLRRMLRSGALKGVKIGQMWLIEMDALEMYLKHVETTSDRRCNQSVAFSSLEQLSLKSICPMSALLTVRWLSSACATGMKRESLSFGSSNAKLENLKIRVTN